MNDLIKRSDAIEAVENVTWYHQNRNKDMVEGANSDEHQAWYKSQDIYEALEALPSADRPQGEWEEKTTFLNADDDPIIEEWQSAKCSVCGKYHTTPYLYYFNDYNYCPNCGARMKGVDDE